MLEKKALALIGCDADSGIIEKLNTLGFYVISLPRDHRLPKPISSHADTLLFCDGKNIFCSDKYATLANEAIEVLRSYGYNIIESSAELGNSYPYDIAFNCFICKGSLVGNLPHTAKEIIEYAEKRRLSFSKVKQGYARCSTVLLGSDGLISADDGILKLGKDLGLHTLKVKNSPEAVSLFGYAHGFIGGASGVFKSNLYFTGNIDLHPDGEAIKKFCDALGHTVMSLSDEKLSDVGGIIFLEPLA